MSQHGKFGTLARLLVFKRGMSTLMTPTLDRQMPLFPLAAVVFPGQEARLSIAEPRYRQLAHECDQTGATFGITTLLGEELSVYGTEVELTAIEKIHSDGSMLVAVKGLRAFRIKQYVRTWPDRLYPGGDVQMLPQGQPGESDLQKRLAATFLLVSDLLPTQTETINLHVEEPSWQFALSAGLSLKQKIKLLSMPGEADRQRLLLGHLTELLPALEKAVRGERQPA